MKITKTILGIISMVLFVLIMFQSCTAHLGNAMNNDTTDPSGFGGTFLAIALLIAGIIAVATRSSKAGGIVAGAFYLFAALIGFTNLGYFGDLVVWSWMSAIFGVICIVGSLFMRKKPAKANNAAE